MAQVVEIVAAGNDRTGEAPTWDAENNRVLWIDAESALVFQLELPNGRKTVICRCLPVSAIALNRPGGLILAGGTGLHLVHGQDNYRSIVTEDQGEALAFNDVIADPKGRIYGGTYYWDSRGMIKTGKLYRIDTDQTVHVMDEGIKLSNGLGFSKNSKILYYADSAERCIYRYDVDTATGDLRNKRVWVKVPCDEGIPDGLTVDAHDFVWCAHWYGGQVVRYDPDGQVQRRITLPVAQVSSVIFGGGDLTDLYITTAGEFWPSPMVPAGFDPNLPLGGSLYRVNLDIPGKLDHQAFFR